MAGKIKQYLIDTDILIAHLRKPELVSSALLEIVENNLGFISIISQAELFAGQSTTDPVIMTKIIKLINLFITLPITEETALLAGKIRRDYGLTLTDALIAATGQNHDLYLMTFNLKDFAKIPQLKIGDINNIN